MRILVPGLLAIAATLGGAWLTLSLEKGQRSAKLDDPVVLEIVKLEHASVPIIRNGAVVGYVIARVSIGVAVHELKTGRPAIVAYAGEAVFRAVYEEPTFDFSALKTADLPALTERMTALANARIGRDVVKKTVIEHLGFVDKALVRSQKSG